MVGTEIVELYVGPQNKLFRVYKKLLCDRVPYFNRMFNGNFQEATEGKATFPDDSPEILTCCWNG